MKSTSKQHKPMVISTSGLPAIRQIALSVPLLVSAIAYVINPLTVHAAESTVESSRAAESPHNYAENIDLGKKNLKEGQANQAIDAFKQALRMADYERDKVRDAYGYLGLAYSAVGDKPKAQACLEKAGAKSDQAPSWIRQEYKRLLISQDRITTAEDMEKLEQAKIDIDKLEAPVLATVNHGTNTVSGEAHEPEEDNDERGFSIGKPAEHTASVDKQYLPKPIIAKPTKPIDRKHIGPTPVKSTSPAINSPSVNTIDIRIIFAVDSAELTPEGEKQADELGKRLQQKLQDSTEVAVLVGHSDMNGGDEYNDKLSEKRAAAVKSYLISKFPELNGKLSEQGMGKRQPLFEEMDEQSQSLNRRVEVKLSSRAE